MARKEKRYHYIYRITCLNNGRYYIGMHSTDNLEDDYMGGGRIIKNSVKKHGKDAHRKEILEFFENREDLVNKEIQLVNEELLNDPMCMNLMTGGLGGLVNENHLERMKAGASVFAINQWGDEEFRKKATLLLIEYIKENHKIGLYKYDKFKGKSHSEETKRSIGEKNSIKQSGEKNSQYGTNWITNAIENKKIHKDSLIPDGWKLGRTKK